MTSFLNNFGLTCYDYDDVYDFEDVFLMGMIVVVDMVDFKLFYKLMNQFVVDQIVFHFVYINLNSQLLDFILVFNLIDLVELIYFLGYYTKWNLFQSINFEMVSLDWFSRQYKL